MQLIWPFRIILQSLILSKLWLLILLISNIPYILIPHMVYTLQRYSEYNLSIEGDSTETGDSADKKDADKDKTEEKDEKEKEKSDDKDKTAEKKGRNEQNLIGLV